jgi:hypothetical protein
MSAVGMDADRIEQHSGGRAGLRRSGNACFAARARA